MWESENQGSKEATLIQTGRRGGVTEAQKDAGGGGGGGVGGVGAERTAPHPRVVDTNLEGHLQNKGSQPQARPPSPGFQHQEDKSPQLLAVKTSGR